MAQVGAPQGSNEQSVLNIRKDTVVKIVIKL